MEPLIAYFILQGLTFDIIGAILLVSIILSFKSTWTPDLILSHKNWIESAGEIRFTAEEIAGTFTKERLTEISKSNEKILKASKGYRETLKKEIEKQLKEFSKKRAWAGLSFLIGGFLLQGIGVYLQLI